MKNYVLWFIMCLYALPSFSQFFTIRESDQSGKERLLSTTRQAIDINSQLIIDNQSEAIIDAVNAKMGTNGSDVIDSLITVLKVYRDILEKLDKAVIAYDIFYASTEGEVDIIRLSEVLNDRATAGVALFELFPEGTRWDNRFNEESPGMKDKGDNEQFRIMLRLLAEEMEFAENDLKKLRKEAGYVYQLAAWSVTNRGIEPIHLEGFDTLPSGEFYEYERNRFYLTEEQKNELTALSAFFEEMDRKNVFENITKILPGLAAKVIDVDAINTQLQTIRESVNTLVADANGEKNKTIEKLKGIEQKWTSLKEELITLKDKYSSPNSASGAETKLKLVQGFMDDFSRLSFRVREISSDVKSTVDAINFAQLGAGASGIKTQLDQLIMMSESAADQMIAHAREVYHVSVYGRKVNAAALELSEQVLKHAVDDIPPTSTLDLRYTGKRDPGDLIVIKAMIRKGDDKHPFITEVREYPIINALQHVHMSVVYAFAKPVIRDSNFKGGPLVSILYKFKSRNLAYRNLFDPGIGFHAASFDFNNDDTPEFAGGMVLSVFKDYIQGGWGFNFNANRGYWFAGLRIPIPTSPVSLMGS